MEHLEILLEDQSGATLVGLLLERLKSADPSAYTFTYRMHHYKGLGKIPAKQSSTSPDKRILLDQLPRLLRGYGRSLSANQAVMVVVDSDSSDCVELNRQMTGILNNCYPKPHAIFCIAIEEIEAWLLGDKDAVLTAYPRARRDILERYRQDSICETWELLADAVCPERIGGLKRMGYRVIGQRKSEWARRIGPLIDMERNASPSFQHFLRQIKGLTETRA